MMSFPETQLHLKSLVYLELDLYNNLCWIWNDLDHNHFQMINCEF